jgi:hypothetical protein
MIAAAASFVSGGREGAAREARTAPTHSDVAIEYDSLNGGPRGGAPPPPSLSHFFLSLALSTSALAHTRRLDALGQCHEFDSSASSAYEQSIAVISYGFADASESAAGRVYLGYRLYAGQTRHARRRIGVTRRIEATDGRTALCLPKSGC